MARRFLCHGADVIFPAPMITLIYDKFAFTFVSFQDHCGAQTSYVEDTGIQGQSAVYGSISVRGPSFVADLPRYGRFLERRSSRLAVSVKLFSLLDNYSVRYQHIWRAHEW